MSAAGDVLFLCHRIPYPPNKGDKIRSYHWLRALASRYRVHLGAFVDDPADRQHEATVRGLCASACLVDLHPLRARARSAMALLRGEPLTTRYFGSHELQRWVDDLLSSGRVQRIVVYSSGVASYAMSDDARKIRRVLDLCDVDSAKWKQYAERSHGPMSWVYLREARTLAASEAEWCDSFDATLVSSEEERRILDEAVGRPTPRTLIVGNGVDTTYFDPALVFPRPFPIEAQAVVFTGAMDYLANIDAVEWFADEVWPVVLAAVPTSIFVIVGSRPHTRVLALAARRGISVTGTVPDVRPFLAHAACAVAPLRIARGVQNKVLEALAMNRPVVALRPALQGISGGVAVPGSAVADGSREMAGLVIARLSPERALEGGREFVQEGFGWEAVLQRFLGTVERAS